MPLKFQIWLLFCSTFSIMASSILAPSLPMMAQHFADIDQSEFWVKLMITLPGGAIAVSAIYLGAMVDRSKKPWLLYASLFIFGICGSAGYFLQKDLYAIVVSRAFLGIAIAGLMVSISTLASRYLKGEDFNRYMGLQAAFGSFGGVVFLILGGVLAEKHWAYPFLIHASALLLLSIALFSRGSLIPQELPVVLKKNNEEITSDIKISSLCMGFFSIFAFMEVVLLYSIPLYFPFYLQSQYGASAGLIGVVMGGVFCLLAITAACYGEFKKYLSFHSLHVLGFSLFSIGFFIVYCASFLAGLPGIFISLLGLCFLGVGFGLCRPNLVVWLFSLVPSHMKGKSMGIMTSCFFLAQFVSPFLFEPVKKSFSLQGVFLFASILGVCVVVALFLAAGSFSRGNAKMFLER